MSEDVPISRRKALIDLGSGVFLAALGITASAPSRAEHAAPRVDAFPSPLTPGDIEHDTQAAIATLKQEVTRGGPAFSGVAEDLFPSLDGQSRMDIPNAHDAEDLSQRCGPAMADLAAQIRPDKYGVFVDGDTQRLFVIQKVSTGSIRLIKKYLVSTSSNPWNDKSGSGGTPTGLLPITHVLRGLLGEILATPHETDVEAMRTVRAGSRDRHFARGVTRAGNGGVPAILTRAFHIGTRPDRDIFIHGTNRVESLGRRASGGCVRMSNVDVVDLERYLAPNGRMAASIPIYIHTAHPVETPPEQASRIQKDLDATITDIHKRPLDSSAWRHAAGRETPPTDGTSTGEALDAFFPRKK